MKLPRDVSGERLAVALCRGWQYRRVHQSGSHIVLETEEPSPQRVAVPNHSSLHVGTFNSILRAVASHKGVTCEAIASVITSKLANDSQCKSGQRSHGGTTVVIPESTREATPRSAWSGKKLSTLFPYSSSLMFERAIARFDRAGVR